MKRARLRIEILKQESDPKAKFELFQRLNTGGAYLSEQEVRNCVAVMLNRDFYDWLQELSIKNSFIETTSQTGRAIDSQAGVELVLRFLAFRHVPYTAGLDVHEYLDKAIIEIASDDKFDQVVEEEIFERTFGILNHALGGDAFKRWDGAAFRGKFLMSVFEVIAHGVAENLDAVWPLPEQQRKDFIVAKAQALWGNQIFQSNSGGGVRGTTRLMNLLPMAKDFLQP